MYHIYLVNQVNHGQRSEHKNIQIDFSTWILLILKLKLAMPTLPVQSS